jgi:hypothetical protein
MSRELEDYRAVQIDIRLLAQGLGNINDEEKAHPDKCTEHDSLAMKAVWSKRKGEFARRREAIKKQLTAKQEQRDMLYLNLSHQPLTMIALAEVINQLTEVEASFTAEGANNAWDKLSAFIDYLETDAERVAKLNGVKAA